LKKLLVFVAFVCLSIGARGQNLTTVSGSNITDINGTKLAAGQVCFLITDQSDQPISVSIGGGGQALKRGYCSPVTAGVITGFTVPNPSATLPSGIYYRVTVKDSSSGLEVLRYTTVSFTGATFNFDNYAPLNLGSPAPLTGNSVTGNLSVTGNVAATGTVTGSNIPSSILQQIFSGGTGLTQRTAFNVTAGITCSDNAGTSRTDCRIGGMTTVTFSATPTFDASVSSAFKITLTANVTSSTLSNAVAGEPLAIEVCQDATGGRTFVPPANVGGWTTIPGAALSCTMQFFMFDAGGTAQPVWVGSLNGVSYPVGVAAHQVGVATAANVVTYKTIPDCQDSSGNHLNYTQSSDSFSCGTTNSPIPGTGLVFNGSTSGTTTVKSGAAAGTSVVTFPVGSGTIIEDGLTQILSAKTLATPLQGITCADLCIQVITGTPKHLTGQTAAITNSAIGTIGTDISAGTYSAHASCITTTSGTGTTATPTISWTDAGGTKTLTLAAIALNSTTITGYDNGIFPIHPTSGAVNLNVSGTFGTSVYACDAWLTREN
jgi:hypothetical protein